MSATSKTVGSGFLGWVGHLADAASGFPGRYGHLLATKRRKTIALTILTVVAIAYPILYQQFLAPFSRNVFPLPLPSDTEVTFMMIFGIMAIGLNIVAGFAGLLDLGYVAFYAIGAYTAAFFASPHFGSLSIVLFANVASGFPGIHLPFWIVLPAAALIAASFGALLGAPTLRLRGDYLAIVTLGFGEIVPVFFKNLAAITFSFSIAGVTLISLQNVNLTGGPLGINPIDPFVILGVGFGATSGVAAPYFGMVLLLIAIVVARNLERSRMGRAWGAIREDETAAEMMGVNTVRTKLLAFALGAAFAGVAGAFQASYLGATTSDFFQFSTSILVLIMVILGGIGNIWGVLAGAIVLVYIDKTFLIWLGQRIRQRGTRLPEPVAVQLPDLRDPARGDDAVPAGGLPAESPARRRAQRPRPPGSRGGDGCRGRDGQHRARRRAAGPNSIVGPRRCRGDGGRMTASTMDVGLTGAIPDDQILVRTRGVTKRFGGLVAVNNVDFDIPRTSIVSLIGPNGAGKTTFFNMITGAYTPTTGQIEFDGHQIVYMKGKKLRSRKPHEVTALGIGRTFQNIRLFGTMSALDNVRAGIHVHLKSHWWDAILRTPAMLNEEIDSIDEGMRLLELVGLERRPETWARNLPYGDQRRLEIARALGTRPKLLLLDEPTAGMNASETREMTDFIRRLRAELGLTVLLIEHDMRVVMGISDRVTVLDHGEVIAEGTPSDVRANPRVVEAYLGRGAAEA